MQPAPTLTVLDAIRQRRSIRSYDASPLTDATVRLLLEAAVQAPTAMHAEPWAFVVIRDRAMLDRCSSRAKEMWLSDLGGRQAEPRKFAGLAHASRLSDVLAHPEEDVFHGAGTVIVICAKPRGPFVVADCWLAAENLMLAATALDVGTCCIGSSLQAFNSTEIKRALNIPDDVVAVAAIAAGRASGPAAPAPRKPPDILYWK